MLWLKALHLIFMVMWFAGLFYLPRLYVYHCQATDEISLRRFVTMERKLFIIMSIGAVGTVLFAGWLVLGYWWPPRAGWLHAKIALAAGLIGYHVYLNLIRLRLAEEPSRYNHVYLRWVNEAPVLFLFTMVILAVVKPF